MYVSGSYGFGLANGRTSESQNAEMALRDFMGMGSRQQTEMEPCMLSTPADGLKLIPA